jgi:hypothetical protein
MSGAFKWCDITLNASVACSFTGDVITLHFYLRLQAGALMASTCKDLFREEFEKAFYE